MRGERTAPEPSAGETDGAMLRAPALRALLAIAFVTVLGSLIIVNADAIVTAMLSLTGAAPEGDALATWFRIAIALVFILFALAGAALFGHRLRLGARNPLVTIYALPTGVGAVALILLPIALAGLAVRGGPPAAGAGDLIGGSAVVLLAALSEELLLRGMLQPVIERAWGLAVAVLLSALAFVAIHVAGGWRDPITLANIFLASVWFGLLAARTGGLAAPTLAHFGYNWSEELLFGAAPNPGVGPHGSLIDIDLVGGLRSGGSADGLNASPILAVVLVLLIAALMLDMRRRPRSAERKASGS